MRVDFYLTKTCSGVEAGESFELGTDDVILVEPKSFSKLGLFPKEPIKNPYGYAIMIKRTI